MAAPGSPQTINRACKPILVGLFFLLGLGVLGCGIKGPPVPPRQPPVPAVTDLVYQVVDQSVRLTWQLAGALSNRQAKRSVFGIYRSQRKLSQPACEGCPVIYEKVSVVATVAVDTQTYTTVLPLEAGYHYGFKVRLETAFGDGPDSDPVQFDH